MLGVPKKNNQRSSYCEATEIVFDEKTHRYLVDGIERPSVTGIVGLLDKPGLNRWKVEIGVGFVMQKIPEIVKNPELSSPEELSELHAQALIEPARIANEAAEHGNIVHALITKYLTTGRKPKCPTPESDTALNAFRIWKQRHKIEIKALEEPFYNAEHGYCGHPDFRGLVDGRRTLIDWKTGRFIKEPFGMQLAAYAAQFPNIEYIGVLNIKDGLPYWKDLSKRQDCYFAQFLALLTYWRQAHEEETQ